MGFHMITILFNVIWLLNLFFLFIKKKSRMVEATSIAISFYIYFYNQSSNDYQRYSWIYNGNLKNGVEPGFLLLVNIGNRLGLSQNQFQGFIASIALIVILYVYSRYSNNFHFFFAMYFTYQYFADLDLLRNFIMRAFLTAGIYMLVKRKKIPFVVCVFIAFLFHRTALLYLPLVFFDVDKALSKKIIKSFVTVIITLCIIGFVFGNNWSWIINIAAPILGENSQKLSYYFTTKTRLGFLIYFVLYIYNYSTIILSAYNGDTNISYSDGKTVIIKTAGRDVQGEKVRIQNNELFLWSKYINLYCLLSFPLIMMNENFYRIFNNIYFINLIYYSKVLDSYNSTTSEYYFRVIQFFVGNLLYRLPFVQGNDQKKFILMNQGNTNWE